MPAKSSVWWWATKKTWATQLDGKRVYLVKGRKNKKAAEEKLKQILAERELLATVNGPITVAALCEHFLEDAAAELAATTYDSYRYSCQLLVNNLGLRQAHTIKPADIRRFRQKLAVTLNETTQGIVLRSILRCFNWGVSEELIPNHSLSKVRKPRGNKRDRYLTDQEFQLMLRATNPKNNHRRGAEFRRLLLALDYTLCRPGELCRLNWEHIRWNENVAILDNHKTRRSTGKPKVIAIVPKMLRLLLWLKQRNRSDHVFLNSKGEPWTVNAINQRVQHIRERAGFGKDVVPYTMRHRAATNSLINTGNLKMTSLLLGHQSVSTTERYTHVAQQQLVKFAEKE